MIVIASYNPPPLEIVLGTRTEGTMDSIIDIQVVKLDHLTNSLDNILDFEFHGSGDGFVGIRTENTYTSKRYSPLELNIQISYFGST